MAFICDFLDLGYVCVVLLAVNVLILTALKHTKIETTVVVCGFLVTLFLLPFLPTHGQALSTLLGASKSVHEKFLLLSFTLLIVYLLQSLGEKLKSIIIICLLIPYLLIDLQLFSILMDGIGILSFSVIVKETKRRKGQDFFAASVTLYCFLFFCVPFLMNLISWKGILPDLRQQCIGTLIEYSDRGLNNSRLCFYAFNNIEDSQERLMMVIDSVKKQNDGTFIFLEDSVAAFTFCRTSLIEPALFDNTTFSYDEWKIGALKINRINGHFLTSIEYSSSKKNNFQLVNESDTALVFKTDFDRLNFNLLCSFQDFLKTFSENYVSKSIILNDKIKLFYYDKDVYDIELL
jgi:hypothetical protein